MPDRTAHQKKIIQAILEKFNAAAETAYRITRWPDEEERNARACDAYAESAGEVPLAIEHTLLPTFELQKQHDAQFMTAIGDLEAELKHAFPYHLSLVIPMFAIQKGQKWSEIKDNLKIWLLSNIAAIPRGASKIAIPGIPFEVSLDRDEEMPPSFIIARWLDSTLNISQQLTERLKVALADKNDQLRPYHLNGNRTLLILESEDIALISRATIYQAFLKAFGQVKLGNVDQVWLAQTYAPEEDFLFIHCLLADQELMDRANPQNAMFGPRYAAHWDLADER